MMHGKASRILKNRFFFSKAIELVEKNIDLMEKKIKKKSYLILSLNRPQNNFSGKAEKAMPPATCITKLNKD